MITLTLLHPIQSIPVQSWTFEQESVVRIGRSTDNHVILYSAVVSRHHVELRNVDSRWEIVNLGANGTYLDGKRITQVPVEDGVIIRLARSGPNVQIHIGPSASKASQTATGENTLAQRIKSKAIETISEPSAALTDSKAEVPLDAPVPVTIQPDSDHDQADHNQADHNQADHNQADHNQAAPPKPEIFGGSHHPTTAMEGKPASAEVAPSSAKGLVNCSHPRATGDVLFCPDCGQPLQTLQTVGEYQVVRILSQDGMGLSQLVWRNGQSLLLRTLKPDWVSNSIAKEQFERQAQRLVQFTHPGIPRYIDFFVENGQPCLIREQVYGQDLNQQVKTKGRRSDPEAIAILLQVCEVLDYLHQQSPPFLHEDLKPENLIQQPLAAANSKITVVGFVSLRSLEMGDRLLANGYSAPEQQQGESTPASDLFALGPTLLYLLTAKDPTEFYAQQEDGFRFYPELAPDLSPELVVVIRKLTNPHPRDRYASAREVAESLTQLLGQS